MLKSNIRSVVCPMAFILSVSASPLREAAPSFINRKHTGVAFTNPPMQSLSTFTVDRTKHPVSLKYRSSSFEETQASMYTDRLWQSALVADSIRHELQPIHNELASKSKDSNEGLIETAKAFIPVAIEIGAVAALAANVPLN